MTSGTIVAIFCFAAALVFVLAPLFRADAAQEERRNRNLSEEEALLSEREMALASLRDLDDDRATGKIGDEDYAGAKAQLTERAVDLMKRLDEVEARRTRPRPEGVPSDPRPEGR